MGRKGKTPFRAKREVMLEFLGLFGDQYTLPLSELRKRAREKKLSYSTFKRVLARLESKGVLKVFNKVVEKADGSEEIIQMVNLVPGVHPVLFLKEVMDYIEKIFNEIMVSFLQPKTELMFDVEAEFFILQDPFPTSSADKISQYISEEDKNTLRQAYAVLRKARRRFVLERLTEEDRRMILEYEERVRALVDKAYELILPILEQRAEEQMKNYISRETLRKIYKEDDVYQARIKVFEESLEELWQRALKKLDVYRYMYYELVPQDVDKINLYLDMIRPPGEHLQALKEGIESRLLGVKPRESPLLENPELKPLYAWLKEHQKEYLEKFSRRLEEAPKILFITGEGWGEMTKHIKRLALLHPEFHPNVVMARILSGIEQWKVKKPTGTLEPSLNQARIWRELVKKLSEDAYRASIEFQDEWQYICQKCGKKSPDKKSMVAHVKEAHPGEDPDTIITFQDKSYYFELLKKLRDLEK